MTDSNYQLVPGASSELLSLAGRRRQNSLPRDVQGLFRMVNEPSEPGDVHVG
jgi:hypothetical protein